MFLSHFDIQTFHYCTMCTLPSNMGMLLKAPISGTAHFEKCKQLLAYQKCILT